MKPKRKITRTPSEYHSVFAPARSSSRRGGTGTRRFRFFPSYFRRRTFSGVYRRRRKFARRVDWKPNATSPSSIVTRPPARAYNSDTDNGVSQRPRHGSLNVSEKPVRTGGGGRETFDVRPGNAYAGDATRGDGSEGGIG